MTRKIKPKPLEAGSTLRTASRRRRPRPIRGAHACALQARPAPPLATPAPTSVQVGGRCAGEGVSCRGGTGAQSQVFAALSSEASFLPARSCFRGCRFQGTGALAGSRGRQSAVWEQSAPAPLCAVLGSPRLKPGTQALNPFQPQSGVLGSRDAGLEQVPSTPPLPPSPSCHRFHPVQAEPLGPERGPLEASERPALLARPPSASGYFPTEPKSSGTYCRGPGKQGAGLLRRESAAAPSAHGLSSHGPPTPALPDGAHTASRVKAIRPPALAGLDEHCYCLELGVSPAFRLPPVLQLSINSYAPSCTKKLSGVKGLKSAVED